MRAAVVLDASALLAYLFGEPGAETVRDALAGPAAISAVNFAEVLSKLSELGQDADAVARGLAQHGLTGNALLIVPLDEAQAREIARLRVPTRRAGASLADRACLALGRTLQLPVLTADRGWGKLRVGVEIRVIR